MAKWHCGWLSDSNRCLRLDCRKNGPCDGFDDAVPAMDDRRKLIAVARVRASWARGEKAIRHAKTIHDLANALSDTLDREARLREVARAGKAYDDALDQMLETLTDSGDAKRLHDEYRAALDNLQPGDV